MNDWIQYGYVMKVTGETVFKALLDLDLVLQDCDQMWALRAVLGSVTPDHLSLVQLHKDILLLTKRVEALAHVCQTSGT